MDDPDLTKHLAQKEAQREAIGSSLGLEGMMKKISSDVTAEAVSKHDYAQALRKSLGTNPADQVLNECRKARLRLLGLSEDSPYRAKALSDVDVFITELEQNG